MKFKKVIAIISSFLIIAGCLSACDSDTNAETTEETSITVGSEDSAETEDTADTESEETEESTEETTLEITEDLLTTTKTVDKLTETVSMRTLTLAGLASGWCTVNYSADNADDDSKLFVAQKDAGDDNSYMYIYLSNADEEELQTALDDMLADDVMPVKQELGDGSYIGIDSDGYFTNIQYDTDSMVTLYATLTKQDEAQEAMQTLHNNILGVDDLYETYKSSVSVDELSVFEDTFNVNGYTVENVGEEEDDVCINSYYIAMNEDETVQCIYYDFADVDTMWSTLANFIFWATNDSFDTSALTMYKNGCKYSYVGDEYTSYAVLDEDNNRLFFYLCENAEADTVSELGRIIAK